MTSPATIVAGQGLTIGFVDTSDWGTGFTGTVTLTNTSATAISNWTLNFTLANAITTIWSAAIASHTGNSYSISGLSYDSTIAPSGSVSFGFQATGGSPILPTSYVFNGKTISAAPIVTKPPTISIGNASVTEGSAATLNETFTVSLSAAATTPVTVAYATKNGTAIAATNYTTTSGTLTFAPGTTSQTITVATKPGAPGTDSYTLALSSPSGATIAQGTATGTIVNPPLPTISVGNASVTEGAATTLNETFTVSLSSASAFPVTVAYATKNGTALAGTNYTATTGTLTFAAGTTSQTITVATKPGATGTESYTLALSAAAGATIAQGTATGTIINPPLPTISVGNASVTEGSAATLNETFTVSLSAASASPVTVAFKTADGTAIAGKDYAAASGTLTFAAGATTETVTVATHPGATGTKTFALDLSAPTKATLGTAVGTGTIVNPAAVTLPTISTGNVTVQETAATTAASGSTLLPSGFLSTKGNQIVSATGTPVKIAAINWYGFETPSYVAQGLWAENYKTMMSQMVQLGFNTIRLPFSLQLFQSGSTPAGINYALNPDLVGLSGLQLMDKIVSYAGQIGIKILLDDHRSAAGSGPNDNGLWYDDGYTQAQWVSTWQMLATHYAGNSTIIGADLLDEPHGQATWGDGSATDWEAAATTAGDAIQSVSPNWLITVEGVQTYNGQGTWWGGNLEGVAAHPVVLTDPNKVVYSPHDYPSSVSAQPWFSAANYPNNLPAVWDQNWGYIYKDGIAPVFVGEFGSTLQSTSDQQWIAALVKYMDSPGGVGGAQGISWGYWDWNPTSGDTGGILENDWSTVDPTKIAAIDPAFYHAGGTTTVSPSVVDFAVKLSTPSASTVTVAYKTMDGTAKAGVNYVAESGTVTFAPGTTTAIVAADLLGNQPVSSSLTFMLALSSPVGATLVNTSATATLIPASVGTSTTTTSATTTTTTTTTAPIVLVTPVVTQSWEGGFSDTVTLTNNGSSALTGWEVAITTPDVISGLYNAVTLSHSGDTYILGSESYNAAVAVHGSASFGFQAEGSSAAPILAVYHSA